MANRNTNLARIVGASWTSPLWGVVGELGAAWEASTTSQYCKLELIAPLSSPLQTGLLPKAVFNLLCDNFSLPNVEFFDKFLLLMMVVLATGHETDLGQHDRVLQAGNISPYHLHQPGALDSRNRIDLRGNLDDSRECIKIIDERQALPQPSGVGGDDASKMGSSGRLATLSVPSKSGKSFAPPPAALVRESLPAPLPPNLRSKGPPMLADPAQVVPLSQYDKFPHYQPNITLAPPKRRASDSQRELCPSETSLDEISRKGQNAIDVLDGKEIVVKDRCRDRNLVEQEQGVCAKASCDLSEKQNLRVMHTRSDGKSYSISSCPSYRSVDEKNFKTLSHLSKENASNGTPVIVSTDRDSNDRKQYFTPQDLGLLSMGGASVPKDLQIIKLDASFVGDGRCGREPRGTTESTPTDLKIFKLVPPVDGSAEPLEEKYSQSQEFAERRKSECVVAIPERVVVKEEVVSDHESGSTCSYWRKNIPQPVTVRKMQQLSGHTSSRAEDYDTSRSPELKRRAGISDTSGKFRDRSCSSSGNCRHRSRSFSPRLVKTETVCRCVPEDALRTVGEIASLLEQWSDKKSATRVLDLVQSLTALLGVPTDNHGLDSLLHPTESLGLQVPSCNECGCSHSVSYRKQLVESSGDSGFYTAMTYAKNKDTSSNEKKKAIPFEHNVSKHSNTYGKNSGNSPKVINEEQDGPDTCTRTLENVSRSKIMELQKLSPVSATLNSTQEKERSAINDDSATISAESSDEGTVTASVKTEVDINVAVKTIAVGEIRSNSGIDKSNEDKDQPVTNDLEVLKNVPSIRGEGKKNESVVVNAACKRQLLEDRGQTLSPELKARICSLEEELTHLKAELQGCKKQKTEPAEDVTKKSASNNRHLSLYVNSQDEQQSSKNEEKAFGFQCESIEGKYRFQTIAEKSLSRDRSKTREYKERRSSTSLTMPSRQNAIDVDEKSMLNSSECQNISRVAEKNKHLKRMEYRAPEDRMKLKGTDFSRADSKNFSATFSESRQSDVVNLKDACYSRDSTRIKICDEREKNRRKLEIKSKSSKP
ncbi:hypothetical protein FHG87_004592 [Trinorchestia longiramus]|nr:hypothetical protein FHG87_004592 [Trinorchestia longiramus]